MPRAGFESMTNGDVSSKILLFFFGTLTTRWGTNLHNGCLGSTTVKREFESLPGYHYTVDRSMFKFSEFLQRE